MTGYEPRIRVTSDVVLTACSLPPDVQQMSHQRVFSIVVPLFNEEDNVRPLVRAVRGAMEGMGDWELILVDDGSTDGTPERIAEMEVDDARVKNFRLSRNYGQTAALQAGFDAAVGDVVITMDGDLQNDPADIPSLVAKLDDGFDLVVGYRAFRQDNLILRRVPSRMANRLLQLITGVSVRDSGCALRAFRRGVVERMHLYSDMHRFMPVVAAATCGARVVEIPVSHHARIHGDSKYGLSRIWKVAADLFVIAMIRSFRERPMALFARGAFGSASVGVLFLVAAVVVARADVAPRFSEALVLPGSALLWLGLAMYLLMLGLIAEVALKGTREKGAGLLPVVREEDV